MEGVGSFMHCFVTGARNNVLASTVMACNFKVAQLGHPAYLKDSLFVYEMSLFLGQYIKFLS